MMHTEASEGGLTTEYDVLELLTTHSPPVVTGSVLEQVLTAVVLALFWISVNAVDGLLLYVIKTTDAFREDVHYTILSINMLCGIVSCNIMFFHVFPSIIANDLVVFTDYYCRISSATGFAIYFTSIHMLAYLALERLAFFKYPFRYNRYFTKSKTTITFIILLSLSLLFTTVTDVVWVTTPVTTLLSCVQPARYRYIIDPTILIVYFVPCFGISLFALTSLGMLANTHRARMYPTGDNVLTQQPIKNFVKKVRKHMKIIILISGNFWLTSLPGMINHMTMHFSGVTWEETDTRRNMTMFILAKIGWFLMGVISILVNPFIYLSLLSDLRQAVLICLRLKA